MDAGHTCKELYYFAGAEYKTDVKRKSQYFHFYRNSEKLFLKTVVSCT